MILATTMAPVDLSLLTVAPWSFGRSKRSAETTGCIEQTVKTRCCGRGQTNLHGHVTAVAVMRPRRTSPASMWKGQAKSLRCVLDMIALEEHLLQLSTISIVLGCNSAVWKN